MYCYFIPFSCFQNSWIRYNKCCGFHIGIFRKCLFWKFSFSIHIICKPNLIKRNISCIRYSDSVIYHFPCFIYSCLFFLYITAGLFIKQHCFSFFIRCLICNLCNRKSRTHQNIRCIKHIDYKWIILLDSISKFYFINVISLNMI